MGKNSFLFVALAGLAIGAIVQSPSAQNADKDRWRTYATGRQGG